LPRISLKLDPSFIEAVEHLNAWGRFEVWLLRRIARPQRFRPLGSIYDRPRKPELLHLGDQCCALHAKLRGSAIRAPDHPSVVFQRAENQIAFDLF
jgi:hypothetical protein